MFLMELLTAESTGLFTESLATESTWPRSTSLKIIMPHTAPLTRSIIRKSKFNMRPSHAREVEVVASPDELELKSA